MLSSYFYLELNNSADYLWLLAGVIVFIFLIIQLRYFLYLYLKTSKFKKKNVKSTTEPVSVIICARNEAENLKELLPSILNQFYPEFEVIVVNDASTDGTADVLAHFKQQYPQLYVTGIEPREGYSGGKKLAQTIGIKAAKFDQLVFTDADCKPASPNWIRHMQSNFLSQTEIVLGYGAHAPCKGLLNKWIRTDTVYIAMQYLGFALARKPYMGVGRNMAYRKELFFKNKGFASHLHIPSGDDDLFVNETTNKYNTTVELHPESFTYSRPAPSWQKWMLQKRRHLGTSNAYKKSTKRLLVLELITRELFFLLSAVMLIFGNLQAYVLIFLFIRTVVFGIVFKLLMKRLKERNLLLFSFLYDLIWPFVGAYLMISSTLKKNPTKWK